MGTLHKATFLLLMFCLTALGRAEYLKYKDPKQPVGARIKDLLGRMTLAEKIGQMTQIERINATAEVLSKYFIGSVLSSGGSPPFPRASAEDWASMVDEMQKAALSTCLGIPMIYGIDAVHGHNNVYKATIFPHNVGLGATRDPMLVKRIGEATALEVRATGIPYVFAPCIAVIDNTCCRDPRWGRCYESYSEDPNIVRSMTTIISGLQGDVPSGSAGRPYVGGRGVSTIMVSFNSWNGTKMHANHYLITDFLKNKLKFRGFVISDWQGIDKITTPPHLNYSYSIEAGIGAGIDMIMVPFGYTEFIDDLTSQVEKNIIPMSRIDDAVYRILRVKFTMGLFENPYADRSLVGELGKQEHRELAREAVRKSLVLLKNGNYASTPLLPLPKKAGTTILSAIKSTVDPSTRVVFSVNPDSTVVENGKYDYAIMVVGEPPYAETFGDNLNLTIPAPGPSVIQTVCKKINCVVVLISGRPLVVEPYIGAMDALVAAWLPGTEGQGVADVLFGNYGFSGKLARTWFKSVDQLPMNVGDKHYDPLFPFGFGLTTEEKE
ncbi:hypothetical protein ACQJBY_051504 [Aegilops geniculata]